MRRAMLRLLNVFRRDAAERELARELAAHMTLLEDDFRRRGMTPEAAHRAAVHALGGVDQTRERHRDARSLPWLDDLRSDSRYAVRSFARHPGFTAVAVTTLALGIGATTAIFSVINAVLLNPLPFKHADRLVRITEHVPASASPTGRPLVQGGILLQEMIELRARSRPFSHMVTYGTDVVTLVGASGDGSLAGTSASSAFLEMLDVSPILGRTFLPEEEAPGGPRVVLLSDSLWRQQFGSDPNVLGKTMTFTGSTTFIGGTVTRGVGYTIVGVMPPAFHFPDDNAQFWTALPLVVPTDGRARRAVGMARLADGVSLEAATDELGGVIHQIRGDAQTPRDRQSRFELTRVQDEITAPLISPLLVLAGAVTFVLLIACVNVANLCLARTTARQREMAVRLALGAGRGRLVRQVLTETVMLGLLGGALGTLLAFGSVRAFRGLAATMSRFDLAVSAAFPRLDAIGIDATALLFTAGVSLAAGLLFGLVPAVAQAWTERVDGLRSGAIGRTLRSGSRGHGALQASLVVAEIALATLLLVGGGLLMHSFVKLTRIDPGYDASHVTSFQVAVRGDRYPQPHLKAFADDLVGRLRSVPGIGSAAYARQLPNVQLRESYRFATTPPQPYAPPIPGSPDVRFVSGDYLHTMGVRLTAGRAFVADGRGASPREVVISQGLARREFPGVDPVGRLVYIGRNPQPFQIVGVATDVRQFGLDMDPLPQFFLDVSHWPAPAFQFPIGPYFVIRTGDRATSAIVSDVNAVARQIDPEATLYNVATMEQIVGNSLVRPRLYAVLLAIFAGVAVTLAAIGIFGVLAYAVTRRTQEIGIRMALGARPAQVLRLVLGRSVALTLLGIALGLGGAAAVTRSLQGMLFGLTPLDPVTYAAVAVTFALVAALASYVPARRATKVDPLVALRYE